MTIEFIKLISPLQKGKSSVTSKMSIVPLKCPFYQQNVYCTSKMSIVPAKYPLYQQNVKCPLYQQNVHCTTKTSTVPAKWPLYLQTVHCTCKMSIIAANCTLTSKTSIVPAKWALYQSNSSVPVHTVNQVVKTFSVKTVYHPQSPSKWIQQIQFNWNETLPEVANQWLGFLLSKASSPSSMKAHSPRPCMTNDKRTIYCAQ